MEKAIEFLRSKGIEVTDKGKIISHLPDDEEGISLINELEEKTMYEEDGTCFTIIKNKIIEIYI